MYVSWYPSIREGRAMKHCGVIFRHNQTTEDIVVSLKFSVFWHISSCSHVEFNRRFRSTYCLHHQDDRPDDGSSKHL
jgi:hypothetical protein